LLELASLIACSNSICLFEFEEPTPMQRHSTARYVRPSAAASLTIADLRLAQHRILRQVDFDGRQLCVCCLAHAR